MLGSPVDFYFLLFLRESGNTLFVASIPASALPVEKQRSILFAHGPFKNAVCTMYTNCVRLLLLPFMLDASDGGSNNHNGTLLCTLICQILKIT